ncbi:hypothetical protein [Hydrocarboniphaga effusa]|jgi:hypothetical protein|uniref:hypothetical protein n=1 Tax=Hydrocarboniphaga effusa TaxID=243629 RepID=UPI003137EE21
MRFVFPFIGHIHQIPHALPIAAELADRYPEAEVHVCFINEEQERFARRLLCEYSAAAPLHFRRLRLPALERWRMESGWTPWKQLALFVNRAYLGSFDAVVAPEQTTLWLKRFVARPKFVWTRHGAGDRASGFASRTQNFDYVLMAGDKIARRLLDKKLIRIGQYSTGIYAKFDWLKRRNCNQRPFFDNGRITVLYNPHFRCGLSSWTAAGRAVLEAFASSSRYNLIFAPHIRLREGLCRTDLAFIERYRGLPHFHIDLGSERSTDMSYTLAADVYLGDVSSQLAEFLVRPRPCVFLNPMKAHWQADACYQQWNLGPVLDDVAALEATLDIAVASHPDFLALQEAYRDETFGLIGQGGAHEIPSSARAADAIFGFVNRSSRWPRVAPLSRDTAASPFTRS